MEIAALSSTQLAAGTVRIGPTEATCVHADAEVIKDIRQNPEDCYINLHNVLPAEG